VNAFCETLASEFGISCTPRVRRGIDIDAGCGQLTSKIVQKQQQEQEDNGKLSQFLPKQEAAPPVVGVYEEDDDEDDEEEAPVVKDKTAAPVIVDDAVRATNQSRSNPSQLFTIAKDGVHVDEDEYDDPDYATPTERDEARRLISLVNDTTMGSPVAHTKTNNTNTIVVDE
jgi:hypothetical protein